MTYKLSTRAGWPTQISAAVYTLAGCPPGPPQRSVSAFGGRPCATLRALRMTPHPQRLYAHHDPPSSPEPAGRFDLAGNHAPLPFVGGLYCALHDERRQHDPVN